MWNEILSKMIQFKKLFYLCGFLLISISTHAENIYELDFTNATGDVKSWFEANNWELREDIEEMNLRFEDGKLVIEPKKDELGVDEV